MLLNEAEAIKNLTQYLDDSFERCVKEIFESTGRVVITGIGKSAIIAQKIVATLNSTGTPSIFMHAADAIHGDLGMIQKNDIVICISKSGNTPEIKVLVPLLKRTGSKLVALVSNTDSYLGQQADYILNATITAEACPNNLAPTTSTTVHLAMGDALAMCLLELRGFTSEDFARYHPGGSLGKQLYMKVDDIYPNNACPIIGTDSPVREAIIQISANRLGATAVQDAHHRLVGIVTDGDVRRMLQKQDDFAGIKVEDMMSRNPKTIHKGDFAVHALRVMQENSISQLVVLDGEKIVGFVHIQDLLREGII